MINFFHITLGIFSFIEIPIIYFPLVKKRNSMPAYEMQLSFLSKGCGFN